MKKSIYILAIIMISTVACTQSKLAEKNKTQAVLGIKEGGKWVWVTKSNGNEQYEYQGGSFKQVSVFKVPEQHTDHSFDIQFEGPGLESDKIGYRLYLDWRNAIDVFGKKTDTLVLNNIGLDGFESYHEIADWGVDVLKVGSSLGMGSLAFWDGEKATRVEKTDSIICSVGSGEKSSEVKVSYLGWEINDIKTDLFSTMEIEEGSYLTKYSVELSKELPNIATGIVTLPGTEVAEFNNLKPGWGCLATFGKQTLQEDNLGMCIFYKTSDLLEITKDKYNQVVVLKPEGNKLTYFFGAAWEQDASGVKTMDDFKEHLSTQIQFLK